MYTSFKEPPRTYGASLVM